jgi:hypothetical protein
MSPQTLLLVLQIIGLVEQAVPGAIELVKSVQKALATDPSVPGAIEALNADASAHAKQALEKIAAWQAEHPGA